MRLLVVVPYRDRQEHLKIFIPHITKVLTDQDIQYTIVVVEQDHKHLFNRGLICNIGFHLFCKEHNYVCFHDVDMIGENIEYKYESIPTHLNAIDKNKQYKEWPKNYFGGIVLFPSNAFIKVNGFSNKYWGWGGEDDDLRLRCQVMNIPTQRKPYTYESLPHPPSYLQNHNYKNNKLTIENFIKSKNKRLILEEDGLNNIENFYDIRNIHTNEQYNMVKINTLNGIS